MATRKTSVPWRGRVIPALREGGSRLKTGWKEFWSWRRIRFSRGGAFFTAGTFAVGFAAINTGNNLLYLLLGAMLGFIAISSWLSEQVIGQILVSRRTPRGVTVGNPLRIQYEVRNGRKRIPAFALEIGEEELPGEAFIPFLRAGTGTVCRSENQFIRRGIFPLDRITVSTSFPFGLFRKTRTLRVPGELVVWPRTDRRVRIPLPGGGRIPTGATALSGAPGPRGEYRGLRGYRPGDDPRDIHWRTTARLGTPVVREYEQNVAETLWICLDTRGEPGEEAEAAVETAASLTARAFREGKSFGLATDGILIEAGHGPGQVERILNALARLDFGPFHTRPLPPVSPRQCVLITLSPGSGVGFGEVLVPQPQGEWDPAGPPRVGGDLAPARGIGLVPPEATP
jgi:uncharacterized protein (DUF58 family)